MDPGNDTQQQLQLDDAAKAKAAAEAEAKAKADADAKAAAAAAGGGQPGAGKNRKTITLPTDTLGKMKREAADKGRREELDRLNALAVAQGFASFEDAIAAAKNARAGKPAGGTSASTGSSAAGGAVVGTGKTRKEIERAERARQRTQNELDQAKKERDAAIKTADRAKRDRQRLETDSILKDAAFSAGIRPDKAWIALGFLREKTRGMSDDELKALDERKFFADLKATEGYLFGETVVPANSGVTGLPGGQRSAAPTGPGKGDAKPGNALEYDAEKLDARLKALGLASDMSTSVNMPQLPGGGLRRN